MAGMPVLYALPDEKGFPHRTQVTLSDEIIEPSTGTVTFTAEIPKDDEVAKIAVHGMLSAFNSLPVRRIRHSRRPYGRLGSDQEKYVFIVTEKNVIERRDVETGQRAVICGK